VIDLTRAPGLCDSPTARDQLPSPSGCLNSAPPSRWSASSAPDFTLSRRQHVRRGCNRLLRPGPWSAPQGSFPILEPWVPAEEFDEVNTHRRADPSCVRVSLNQRVA